MNTPIKWKALGSTKDSAIGITSIIIPNKDPIVIKKIDVFRASNILLNR